MIDNNKAPIDDILAAKLELEQLNRTLRDNYKRYDDLSRQLQQPATRSKWIAMFKLKSQSTPELYAENNQCIARATEIVTKYHNQDIAQYNNDLTLSDLMSPTLRNVSLFEFSCLSLFISVSRDELDSPFTLDEAVSYFAPDFTTLMPRSEISLLLYALAMITNAQISYIGEDSTLKKMVYYCRKVLEFSDSYDSLTSDFLRCLVVTAYRHLLDIRLINKGILSADEAIAYWSDFLDFEQQHKLPTDRKFAALMRSLQFYVKSFVPRFAIAYYSEHNDLSHATWLYRELTRYVEHYKDKVFDYPLYAHSMRLLGKWSDNETYENISKFYLKRCFRHTNQLPAIFVLDYLYITQYTLRQLVETDYSIEVKQVRIVDGIERVLDMVKRCNEQRSHLQLTQAVCEFLCDAKLNAHFNTKQRLNFLMSTLRGTSVQTYAHSRMVARLCEEILNSILTKKPELLIGLFGIASADEVPAKAAKLNSYIIHAAMFHDIGKLSMIHVVNNEYCHLTDHEFKIIKMHPERGVRFLDLDPKFSIFHDAVVGHHKWYNGQGGYPQDYDNTRSPYRILVDILSIADCIEAATDNLGRNYSRNKSFRHLFKEMSEQAGTRYNPDIIELIKQDKRLYRSISEMMRVGWEYNYYEVYLDYFGKR